MQPLMLFLLYLRSCLGSGSLPLLCSERGSAGFLGGSGDSTSAHLPTRPLFLTLPEVPGRPLSLSR